MSKKASGTKYVSKGTGIKSVTSSTLNAMKSNRPGWEKQFAILNAWKKGQNPWITIENPNKNDLGKRHIKVRLSDLKGGSYKDIEKRMYTV